jgi:tRNA-dihydrouridine synthase A
MIKKLAQRTFKKSLINPVKERIAIAPMVDVTDNYFRHFMRYLTKNSFLYTEMLNEHAIIHIEKTGNTKLLDFSPV